MIYHGILYTIGPVWPASSDKWKASLVRYNAESKKKKTSFPNKRLHYSSPLDRKTTKLNKTVY